MARDKVRHSTRAHVPIRRQDSTPPIDRVGGSGFARRPGGQVWFPIDQEEPAIEMPGTVGRRGATGAAGAPGAAGARGRMGLFGMPGLDAEDPEISIPWPGKKGAAGSGLPFSGCACYQAGADQSINDATFTAVTFDTEDYDTDAYHSIVSNTSRFTVPTTAKYHILFCGLNEASATGQRVVKVRKNGVTDLLGGGFFAGNPSATWAQSVIVANTYPLTAGDYIEIMAYQNSGVARILYGSGLYYSVRCAITRAA